MSARESLEAAGTGSRSDAASVVAGIQAANQDISELLTLGSTATRGSLSLFFLQKT